MDLDPEYLRQGLIIFILLVGSIVIHEWAHAIAAHLLGDDTPRLEGRLTLDPRAHFDVIGTLLVPLFNIFFWPGNFLVYGWGRPVVTNPANFRHRIRDDILVSLAGPAANLLLALVAIVAGSFIVLTVPKFAELIKSLVIMNVGLAVINLLPIPPLDGGAVLRRLVGLSEDTYLMLSRWSFVLILALSRFSFWQLIFNALIVGTLEPYAALCNRISPLALERIFHP